MKVEYKEVGSGPRPLEGIRVVEYGVFHAGPGGGAILGDGRIGLILDVNGIVSLFRDNDVLTNGC